MSFDAAHIALYHPYTKEWLFSHDRGKGTQFHALGPARCFIPKTRTLDAHLGKKPGKGFQWKKAEEAILHDLPELGFGVDAIDGLVEESNVINVGAEVNETLQGEMLAFGKANEYRESRRGVEVAAYGFGEAGTELGVGKVTKQKIRLEVDRDGDGDSDGGESILVPELLGSQEPVYRFTTPIRQLRFASDPVQDEPKPYLAVRTVAGSTICKIQYRSNPYVDQSPYTCEPIAEVGISSTGGSLHADITFNPFNDRQFAVVNDQGTWSMWDYEVQILRKGRPKKPLTKPFAMGSLGDYGKIAGRPQDFGWANVRWGQSPMDLFVATRTHVSLFDIRTPQTATAFMSLLETRDHAWILDTQTLPVHPHQTLLLTSSSLLWLDLRYPARRISSILHYRPVTDTSLKLSLYNSPGDNVTSAFIYSRLNSVVTTVQAELREKIQPSWLDIPGELPLGWDARPLTIVGLPVQSGTDAGKEDSKGHMAAYYTSTDLSVNRRIFTTRKEVHLSSEEEKGKSHRGGGTGGQYTQFQAFITPDIIPEEDEEEEDIDPPSIEKESTTLDKVLQKLGVHKNKTPGTWTPSDLPRQGIQYHEMSDLYAFVFAEWGLKASEEGDEALLREFEKELRGVKGGEGVGYARVMSLFEIHPPESSFDDLDLLSEELDKLYLENVAEKNRRILNTVGNEDFPFAGVGGAAGGNTISAIYHRIINTWVKPLPAAVPPRVRLRRERIARRMAIDAWLCSQGVLIEDPESHYTTPPETTIPETTTPTPGVRGIPYFTPTTLPRLTRGTATLLSGWSLGENPHEYEWRPLNQGDVEDVQRQRSRSRSRSRTAALGPGAGGSKRGGREEVVSSSLLQPVVQPVAGRQVDAVRRLQQLAGSQGRSNTQVVVGTGVLESQSQSQRVVGGMRGVDVGMTMSQPAVGRFGGRQGKGQLGGPQKKKRRQGF